MPKWLRIRLPYFYWADTSKARVGICLYIRKGDWIYLDIDWYWGGMMWNFWRLH